MQDVFGDALYLAQAGKKHEQAKPLRGFGSASGAATPKAEIDLIRERLKAAGQIVKGLLR